MLCRGCGRERCDIQDEEYYQWPVKPTALVSRSGQG